MPVPILSAIKGIFNGGDLIEKVGGIIDNVVTTKEEKEKLNIELQNAINGHMQKMEELALHSYQAEVEDRSSARTREVEVAKTGKFDFMMNLAGVVGLGAFGYIIYVIANKVVPVENRELLYHLIGMVEGVALTIFAYYFGSSKGSKDKTKALSEVAKGK